MTKSKGSTGGLSSFYSTTYFIMLFYIIMECLTISGNLFGITSILIDPFNILASLIILISSIIGIFGLYRRSNLSILISFSAPLLEVILSILYLMELYVNGISMISLWTQGGIVALISLIAIYTIYSITMNSPVIEETLPIPKNNNLMNQRSEYAIELIDVVKIYDLGPVKVNALNGINLKVKHGDLVAIMGPSGSGKSTLLNQLGALDRPTSGKVIIDGIDISTLDDDQLAKLRNEKIGFIFQSYNLITRSTVIRNVELPAIIKGIPKEKRINKALKLLKILGLEETAYRRPKTLSGGQQQRVAIARALINDPQIILADEPTGNLDSKSGSEVMKYLIKMNRELGTTVIIVTHDREIGEATNRIFHIKDGVIIKEEVLRGN